MYLSLFFVKQNQNNRHDSLNRKAICERGAQLSLQPTAAFLNNALQTGKVDHQSGNRHRCKLGLLAKLFFFNYTLLAKLLSNEIEPPIVLQRLFLHGKEVNVHF